MQNRKISEVEYWEIIEAPEHTKNKCLWGFS
jgi:hypothetical protein